MTLRREVLGLMLSGQLRAIKLTCWQDNVNIFWGFASMNYQYIL